MTDPLATQRSSLSRLFWVVCILVITFGAYGTMRWGAQPAAWPGQILLRQDTLDTADYIVVLMGSPVSRAEHAAELYKRGWAPKIVFARSEARPSQKYGLRLGDGQATVKILKQLGVASDAIEFLAGPGMANTSTRDEAEKLWKYLSSPKSGPVKRVILVTDWYHSARAAWIFEQFRPTTIEMIVAPATTANSHPDTWYRHESSFILTFNEYLKWLYYLWNY